MLKRTVVWLVVGLAISSTGFFVGANAAATIKNGVACSKSGATAVVTFKGVKTTYVCTTNPAAANNPNIAKSGKTWTLKTCVSYYAAAQGQQDNINQQLPLIALMSEPDKTKYGTQLKDSQAKLMQVIAAIENNYCKTGL
jgi:hypothetical protein